jgi:hypothetical protein
MVILNVKIVKILKEQKGDLLMMNRFLLAIIFPSATQSRVLRYASHSCGTATLLFAALDREPAYGKRSRILKPFNTILFSIIFRKGSLLVPSRLR